MAIDGALIQFAPITINVGDNVDLSNHGGPFLDWIDVFAGDAAELYLTLCDRTFAANRSMALPFMINLADWPNHDIVFSPSGVYATGPIDYLTSRVMPEPQSFRLLAVGSLFANSINGQTRRRKKLHLAK